MYEKVLSRNNTTKSICLSCKNIFIPNRGSYGKYCSNKCHRNTEFLKRYYRWLQHNEEPWVTPKPLKSAIEKRDGYKCSECGIDEWNNKFIGLEIEHKDGNSINNKSSNVCLICPNCHSQTDTYKAKNKGKGRHFRMERYRDGKSF